MPVELWASLIQSFMHGSRSTALKALLYLDAFTLTGVIALQATHAPPWLSVFLAVAFGLAFLCTLAAYAYFMVINSDALRSEKFVIDKLSIEKGLVGDNATGLARLPAERTIRIGDTREQARLEHGGQE
jgi:hypothetical protein